MSTPGALVCSRRSAGHSLFFAPAWCVNRSRRRRSLFRGSFDSFSKFSRSLGRLGVKTSATPLVRRRPLEVAGCRVRGTRGSSIGFGSGSISSACGAAGGLCQDAAATAAAALSCHRGSRKAQQQGFVERCGMWFSFSDAAAVCVSCGAPPLI